MILTCFQIYFNPVYLYFKRVVELAGENDFDLTLRIFNMTAISTLFFEIFKIEPFGVPNFIILLVVSTILIDAIFGVKKSKKQSVEFYEQANNLKDNDAEKKMLMKKGKLQEFDVKKLQFTFFKCLTLLFYLYIAKNMLNTSDSGDSLAELIGFAAGVVIKVPIAIFWYYDFKSIGNNSAYIYGKKAPIFTIVEKMFEPKLNNFFNTNS